MAAMLTLFVCLLLIDFTRSDRSAPRQPAVNATSRSFEVDERGAAGGKAPPPREEQEGPPPAYNHRYRHPFQYAYPHLYNYPRMRDYGRSLKGQAADDQDNVAPPATAEAEELPDHPDHPVLEDREDDEGGDDWEDQDSGESDSEGSESWELDTEAVHGEPDDEDEEEYDEVLTARYPLPRLLRSLDVAADDSPTAEAGADPGDVSPPQQAGDDMPSAGDQDLGPAAGAGGGVGVSGPSTFSDDAPSGHEAAFHETGGVTDGLEDGMVPSGSAPSPQRLTAAPPPPAQDRSDEGRAVVLRDDHPAVALPFQGAADLRWPGVEDRDRERWAELVRLQQQAVQARRAQQESQRRYYSELGTIHGEQYMMPHYATQAQENQNLGPVLFPAASKQQQQAEMAPPHFVPKKLMKMMVTQQGGGGGGKPWTFIASPQLQASQNQNQYLVVNSKGVVIPHSVNFPDIVKTANYPQLQNYRNQQSNKNVQDIISYLKSKGVGVGYTKRPYSLSSAILKNKATKVYGKPQQAQAAQAAQAAQSPDFDVFSFPRPEPYVKEMAAMASEMSSAESSERPGSDDSQYNGHAYIADPFHPYKPSDPTEINQMASSYDSDTSASASSERVRPYLDVVGEPFALPHRPVFSGVPPANAPGGPGRYGRLRNPFLQPGGPQYTEATFKPLGGDLPALPLQLPVSEHPSTAAGRGGPSLGAAKSVPPLSVMLEIFPMGEAKTKEGAATVMWNNFPVAALRPVVRRPPSIAPSFTPGLVASLGAGLGAGLGGLGAAVQQADASVRRPVVFPPEAAASASAASRFPVLMQGQLSAPGHSQPAFGVTLSGVQGLQALSGMPMLDSKHRMVVHLNFYPKKQMSVPMRFRDLSGADHIPQGTMGATLIPGGTFPQRRQGAPEDADASTVGSMAVDLAPLLQSLPPDVQRHLAAIVQTYQKPAAAGGANAARDDDADDFDDSASDETDEDYADDKSGEAADTKRHTAMGPRAVDAEPSYAGSSSEEDYGDANANPNLSSIAQWLIGRDRPWAGAASPGPPSPKPQKKGASSAAAAAPARKGSYFDVQDDEYGDDRNDRPHEDEVHQDGVVEADKRLGHDVENELLQQKRLQLWRYWKEMQALQKDGEKKKRKRKKVSGRTQRGDTYTFSAENPEEAVASAEQLSVPKNHRLE